MQRVALFLFTFRYGRYSAFSADGRRAACMYAMGEVKVYDTKTQEQLVLMQSADSTRLSEAPKHLWLTPNGERMIVGFGDNNSSRLKVFDLSTNAHEQKLLAEVFQGATTQYDQIACSTDGQYGILNFEAFRCVSFIGLQNRHNHKIVKFFDYTRPSVMYRKSAAFSHDSKYFAVPVVADELLRKINNVSFNYS